MRCCEFAEVEHHRIYGLSMLGIGQLFKEDYNGLDQTLNIIEKSLFPVRQKYGLVYPLEGSIIGLRLVVDAQLRNGLNQNAILENLALLFSKYRNIVFERVLTFASLVRTCVEILVWAGLFYEAKYIIETYGVDETYKKRFINRALDPVQQIQLAIIYIQTDDELKAKRIFKNIQMDHIRFDRKAISTLLYQLLHYRFIPKTALKRKEMCRLEIQKLIKTYRFDIFEKQIAKFG